MATKMATVNDVVLDAQKSKDKGSDDYSAVYTDIVRLQQQDRSNATHLQSTMSELNTQLHQRGILNDVDIVGVDNANHLMVRSNGKQTNLVASNIKDSFVYGSETSYLQGAKNVGYDLAAGSWDELRHHTLRVAASAAIGFGVGVVGAVVAPEIAAIGTVVGIGYVGYQLYEHIPGWFHSAKVVANPGSYSPSEVGAADHHIEDFGAGAVDVAAGLAGGYAGSKVGAAIKASWKQPDVTTPAQPKEEPKISLEKQTANKANAGASQQQGDGGQSAAQQPGDGGQSAAQPVGDGHHGAAAAQPGDPSQGTDKSGAVPKGKPVTKVEAGATTDGAEPAAAAAQPELTLETSIAKNQASFRAAVERGDVIPMQKQDYNVMFRKVLENGTVDSIETRGAGETVQAGHWIATQLNPDGTPNMVGGKINQWPVEAPTILKSYKVTPEQIASMTEFVAGTKTDGPQVFMVKLETPVHFKTSWGEIFGKAGDWFANYDYDPATGKVGSSFNVIDKGVWGRTYEPVKVPPTA